MENIELGPGQNLGLLGFGSREMTVQRQVHFAHVKCL
jgi:hypothetical protein